MLSYAGMIRQVQRVGGRMTALSARLTLGSPSIDGL